MRTAVFTAIYPAAKPFLDEYFAALKSQTESKYELFLVADSIDQPEIFLSPHLKSLKSPWSVHPASGTPPQIRKQGITEAIKQGFEALIFADIDDRMAPNRVEVSREYLSRNSILVNEVLLVGKNLNSPVSFLKPRFRDGQKIGFSDIKAGNCLGLSNTAILTKCLETVDFPEIPDYLVAFDWALYFQLLHRGEFALFTDKTWTEYRQHDQNCASPIDWSPLQIQQNLETKYSFYRYAAKFDKSFQNWVRIFEKLIAEIRKNPQFLDRYVEVLRARAPANPLWWENIQPWEFS